MVDVQNVEHALAVYGGLALVVFPLVSAMLNVLASVFPNVAWLSRLANALRELGTEIGKAASEWKGAPAPPGPGNRGFVDVRVMGLIATCALLAVGCAWLQANPTVSQSAEHEAAYGACLGDLAIAKSSASRAVDGGALTADQKGILWARYRQCSAAVDSLFDGGL